MHLFFCFLQYIIFSCKVGGGAIPDVMELKLGIRVGMTIQYKWAGEQIRDFFWHCQDSLNFCYIGVEGVSSRLTYKYIRA
jgi:hypothetical protein